MAFLSLLRICLRLNEDHAHTGPLKHRESVPYGAPFGPELGKIDGEAVLSDCLEELLVLIFAKRPPRQRRYERKISIEKPNGTTMFGLRSFAPPPEG
jgi:hypothetical protein